MAAFNRIQHRQHPFQVLIKDHQHISGLGAAEGLLGSLGLAGNQVQADLRQTCPARPFVEQPRSLSRGPATEVIVLLDEQLVEGRPQRFSRYLYLVVAPVAGYAHHPQQPAWLQGPGKLGDATEGRGIVAKVHDHHHPPHPPHHQAPRIVGEFGAEGAQAVPDYRRMQPADTGRRGGGQGVLQVMQRPAAHSGPNGLEADNPDGLFAPAEIDAAVLGEHGAASGTQVTPHQQVVPVHAEIDQVCPGSLGKPGGKGVVGVQHHVAVLFDRLRYQRLDPEQVFQGLDPVLAEVVRGDVGDYRHVSQVVTQPGPQDTTPGSLQHRHFHRRVTQHGPGAVGAGGVSLADTAGVDVDPPGSGHPNGFPLLLEDVPEETHGGGLAVGPGYRDYRNTCRTPGRKQIVHQGLPNRTGDAPARVQVHPEAWSGVDLDDPAAGLPDRGGNIRCDQVDPGHVQTQQQSGLYR